MITEISKEVEAKIPEYVERFRSYGLRTTRVNKEVCVEVLKQFGEYLGTSIKKVEFSDSPNAIINMFKGMGRSRSEVINGCNWGNIYSYWASYYTFIERELPVNKTGLVDMLESIIKECPPFWIDGDVIYVADFPTKITFDGNQKLHCDDGKAIEYIDKSGVYSLHGIRVPEWLVETPKIELSPEKILGIKNAEIRLAGIRHVGLHNFLNKLDHKIIDQKEMSNDKAKELGEILDASLGDKSDLFRVNNPDIFKYSYELLLVKIEGRFCEFLKMVNPSTGEIHMEGVQPGIKTVNQALAWRMGLDVLGDIAFEA